MGFLALPQLYINSQDFVVQEQSNDGTSVDGVSKVMNQVVGNMKGNDDQSMIKCMITGLVEEAASNGYFTA